MPVKADNNPETKPNTFPEKRNWEALENFSYYQPCWLLVYQQWWAIPIMVANVAAIFLVLKVSFIIDVFTLSLL